MKILNISGAMAAAAMAIMTSSSVAESTSYGHSSPWLVYRAADGQLPPESRQNARKMQQKAARDGYITLWLLLDSEIDGQSGPLTDEEYGLACVEMLQPLVDRLVVWHPTNGPSNSGPVCLIRASAAGVAMLVRDERLHQIMGAH